MVDEQEALYEPYNKAENHVSSGLTRFFAFSAKGVHTAIIAHGILIFRING